MDALQELRTIETKIEQVLARLDKNQMLLEELLRRSDTADLCNTESPSFRKASPLRTTLFSLKDAVVSSTGKRPLEVIFPGGHRVTTSTWKKVFESVLMQCNSEPEYHQMLMELRGRLMARSRMLLDDTPGNMRSPVQIDRDLFAETHYDAGTLLRILTTRILDELDYDYSEIRIAVRST